MIYRVDLIHYNEVIENSEQVSLFFIKSSYAEVMETVIEYFHDENIFKVTIEVLSDCDFIEVTQDIANKISKEIVW